MVWDLAIIHSVENNPYSNAKAALFFFLFVSFYKIQNKDRDTIIYKRTAATQFYSSNLLHNLTILDKIHKKKYLANFYKLSYQNIVKTNLPDTYLFFNNLDFVSN